MSKAASCSPGEKQAVLSPLCAALLCRVQGEWIPSNSCSPPSQKEHSHILPRDGAQIHTSSPFHSDPDAAISKAQRFITADFKSKGALKVEPVRAVRRNPVTL